MTIERNFQLINGQLISRIAAAIKALSGQIDGGEECRGRDQEITEIINILEGR